MKLLSLLAGASALALTAGCASTAGTSVVLNHDTGASALYEGSTSLHNSMAVTAVTYVKVPAGLNRANFQLTSLVQRQLNLQYRISWYNSEGMEIDAGTRTYRSLILHGQDSVTVTGVANNPAAVKSRLRVREVRSLY